MPAIPYRLLLPLLLPALLAGCASTPKPPPPRPAASRAHMGPVIDYALSLQGTPYVWGGESMEEGGFDCSGFVQHVYRRHGVRLPRTARQMAEALPPLDRRDKRPGDLLFFNTTGEPYSHVGIYIGHNAFVHSSSAKGGVIVSSLDKPYWWEHLLGIRRPGQLERWLDSAAPLGRDRRSNNPRR
ncbi:Cell wall-associated hydrolase, NlpC family [Methylomagnum ishizawai]|uniref:Cell wall-associated hydrolase, NlpC family n=1 Tax=Methylomagnum ishizawai TaxID=1760988 RepID=A0A1Y6CZK5_9GAMM|nr:C40 family peptidase [Methylomagnum ishizawai]SMF95817.1 Cell wall-associated hydrolase, NlpC family [Methylomagnum ishizawai]